MPHPIDYAVYQHVFNQSDAFINYLKEINEQVLVKTYSLNFEYAAVIMEEVIKTKPLTLEKQGEETTCTIDGLYTGTSIYPSMAVCLAVLDVYGQKAIYEKEATRNVQEHIEEVKRRSEALERRLNEKG